MAKEIVSLFPLEYGDYFEPFLGGGSLFLYHLQNAQHDQRKFFLSDLNKDIISWWNSVKTDVDALIDELRFIKSLYENHDDRKKNYQNLRSVFNLMSDYDTRRAAWFFFLVNTAFDGLSRYNKKGEFNAAFGGLSHSRHGEGLMRLTFDVPQDCLKNLSDLLSQFDVTFNCLDFQQVKSATGDLVVLDPPYVPFQGRKIDASSYNPQAFKLHNEVVEYCRKIDVTGGYFLLCNHFTEDLADEFSDAKFVLIRREHTKTFSGKSDSRQKTLEIFVRNFS